MKIKNLKWLFILFVFLKIGFADDVKDNKKVDKNIIPLSVYLEIVKLSDLVITSLNFDSRIFPNLALGIGYFPIWAFWLYGYWGRFSIHYITNKEKFFSCEFSLFLSYINIYDLLFKE